MTRDGTDLFLEWRRKLRDLRARFAIDRRTARLEYGNFGDHKFCRNGVWEMRIDVGAGYRIYYAIEDVQVVLLLTAGDKQSQDADIDRAVAYWKEWKGRAKG